MSFAKNIGKNFGKNISKNCQKLIDHANQSATDAFTTALIKQLKKAETTGNLISNKIEVNIAKVLKTVPPNNSETVAN